jgi:hypothetical protein
MKVEMVRTACCVAFLMLAASPLSAQPFYGGGIVAADSGRHGFDLGTFPAAGGFVGWRFLDAWSVEFHFDRGFGESPERERIEIFGTSTVADVPGNGRAVLFVWKTRRQARVNAAVTMGIAVRSFSTDRLSINKIPPDDPYPVTLGPATRDGGGGWAGGVLFPIALGRRVSLAPEVRVTVGLTGEHGEYAVLYSGVRMMWGF